MARRAARRHPSGACLEARIAGVADQPAEERQWRVGPNGSLCGAVRPFARTRARVLTGDDLVASFGGEVFDVLTSALRDALHLARKQQRLTNGRAQRGACHAPDRSRRGLEQVPTPSTKYDAHDERHRCGYEWSHATWLPVRK